MVELRPVHCSRPSRPIRGAGAGAHAFTQTAGVGSSWEGGPLGTPRRGVLARVAGRGVGEQVHLSEADYRGDRLRRSTVRAGLQRFNGLCGIQISLHSFARFNEVWDRPVGHGSNGSRDSDWQIGGSGFATHMTSALLKSLPFNGVHDQGKSVGRPWGRGVFLLVNGEGTGSADRAGDKHAPRSHGFVPTGASAESSPFPAGRRCRDKGPVAAAGTV